ncbi:uncharacterized protein BJX67DRAFT_349635 [Aspergillus lucknowensis]|uniref:Putative zinc-finger domain-containing protein n=1 Tax=Aspergillus lucknowensis TaxID=176173 RepID=A0ABR4LVI0_9EURO
MSDHPIPPPIPSWGHPNYTQQWASHPSTSIPHNMQYQQNPPSAPQNSHNLESFNANANIPGFGGPGTLGSLPHPLALPSAFPPPAAPSHYPYMSNMGYHGMPLPLEPPNLPTSGLSTNDVLPEHSNAPDSRPMTTISSQHNPDREEGELTDTERSITAKTHHTPGSVTYPAPGDTSHSQESHITSNARDHGKPTEQAQLKALRGLGDRKPHNSNTDFTSYRASSSSELEEGEASPEPHPSTRDSGSPYNPSMAANAEAPFTSKSFLKASRHPRNGFDALAAPLSPPAGLDVPPSAGKSLAPLRVQAQGALLSLAPHNIRFSELVSEGINPMILRQLYEEIGIRIPTTPSIGLNSGALPHEDDPSIPGSSVSDGHSKQLAQELEVQTNTMQKPALTGPSPTLVQASQAKAAKPMERKEVIARMLAAKAAKKSPVSVPSQTDTPQAASTPSLSAVGEKPAASAPPQDPSSRERESRVKEKNKAQTELARQRIEQLKKQGLMKRQQKIQSDSQVLEKEQPQPQVSLQAAGLAVVQHPLPERPPVPEATPLDRIPGLFMAEQTREAANGVQNTSVQELLQDSTPQPRASQRKRPRASDFDDPIPLPKRTFSNGTSYTPPEKLVIDISDDEFYGDDENGAMQAENTTRDLATGATSSAADVLSLPPVDGLPHQPARSQSQSFSTSSTPNNFRSSEHEDLRKKDLEIQAMHRRIAELEQRKKARLASRTQSPRNSDISPPELVSVPSMPLPALSNTTDGTLENALAPLDANSLRKMKSKILRIQEIEAGVPSLDEEIQKSEARLSDFKREEEKVLSELEKGKAGRRQLLEELSALKSELNGLSLNQLNMELIRLEAKEELPVEAVQGMIRRLSIPALLHSDTATYDSYDIASGYGKETSDENDLLTPDVSGTDEQVQGDTALLPTTLPAIQETLSTAASSDVPNAEGNGSLNGPENEPSDTSMSEGSSSAMDESTDSSSSSSALVNEEIPDAQEPERAQTTVVNVMTTTSPETQNGLSTEVQLSRTLLSTNSPSKSDTVRGAGETLAAGTQNRLASRESSVSEAYEPPEPERSPSFGSNSSYSPAPSPDSPDPATNLDTSGTQEDPSQEAGELLTGKIQELDFQQPSHFSQVDILDNTRRPEDTQRIFSPYASPLKLFKAYRFHPKYSNNVSGGYRSLTYSHNIDPLKYMCPFEASGGVCNDRSCEYQHFRDMALSDDKILVQMGSLREGKTPEECDKYVAGLKGTINDMRRDKVKDMNTVAAEIAAYRRRFLQDPTRVLAL